jgi:flagellar basal-body rod modification protein FlgD
MTIVPSTAASAPTQGPATRNSANMVNYEAFLQLLVAQMKNQDPTQPTDSGEYLSQLASFSGVEQAIQTNDKLDAMLAQSAIAQAGALVGRHYAAGDVEGVITSVTYTDGTMMLTLQTGEKVKPGNGATIS